MRKQGKLRKNRKAGGRKAVDNKVASPAPDQEISTGRRNMLRQLRNGAIAALAVGAAGYYSVSAIRASLNEADLGKIGNGLPAIVQIHDPQCGHCRTLQSQTRSILADYDEEKFEYLVANIKTKKGRDLANQYGVPHVTLLLFDAKGEMIRVVRGPIRTETLSNFLAVHLEAAS